MSEGVNLTYITSFVFLGRALPPWTEGRVSNSFSWCRVVSLGAVSDGAVHALARRRFSDHSTSVSLSLPVRVWRCGSTRVEGGIPPGPDGVTGPGGTCRRVLGNHVRFRRRNVNVLQVGWGPRGGTRFAWE